MKRSTIQLLVIVSVLYFVVLYLFRSFLPQDFTVPLYFLVPPLLAVLLVLISDLSSRATLATSSAVKSKSKRMLGWDVQRLSQQIEVASRSSGEYYDSVLLQRLRAVLVEKVSLEMGMDNLKVHETLKNRIMGPALLRDKELYSALYSRTAARGQGRVRLLEEAMALIEAWKP